ncbi:MAG: ribbon-helix-helix domain-containing protein [Actinobacteria bacterium]|nr:ribbon-helix-helix domain-containing protein [Actinomycetota bacterium]
MKKRQKTYRLKSGIVVKDSDIERMADDVATRDFDLSKFTRLPGRPLMGKAVAQVVPVRIEPAIVKSIDRRAKIEGITRSDIIRQAINTYLAS